MGLAEPRKRLKIAHDPRNLHWSSTDSTQSFGKRLMQQQGWEQGQSLGARPAPSSYKSQKATATTELDTTRLAAAKVGVIIKDNTLGLGAQLKSKDVQHQKTGLDAFQGLLGRLNGKSEEEVRIVEKKGEERRLEMYARGRWGGMVFVRGGVLVQGEEFKKKADAERRFEEGVAQVEGVGEVAEEGVESVEEQDEERRSRKAEKRRLKEEKRARREQRRARKAAKAISQTTSSEEDEISNPQINATKTVSVPAPDEAMFSSEEEITATPEQPRKRRRSSINAEEAIKKQLLPLKNGRHLLRGKNIEAKRKAFSDMKGLDAIFMRT